MEESGNQSNENQSATVNLELLKAIIAILETTNSPAIQKAREAIAYRIAISGDVAPGKIPPPLNITEIGGYINLLTEYGETEQRSRMLAAALGIAGPQVSLPQSGELPTLFFATRQQQRPEGPNQPSLPLSFNMRSDFIGSFDEALSQIANNGAVTPILSPMRVLPAIDSPVTEAHTKLNIVGRRLTLAPTSALHDPLTDPLSVSRPSAAGSFAVLARVTNTMAPGATVSTENEWVSWQCNSTTCQEIISSDIRFDITPFFNQAGWYQLETLANPENLMGPGNWNIWLNITSLVPGQTTFGEELQALYSTEQILSSSVRDMLGLLWNGNDFV